MADLTLDDLMRWQPGWLRLGVEGSAALDRPVSWAVTIRSMTPVLPSLRGGELVVVPARLLSELTAREAIGWSQLLDHLETLPVSGVVTDQTPPIATSRLVVLESMAAFTNDVEAALNREIIERRSELYQLGSELARALSAASIAGSDLEEVLGIAGEVGHMPVALLAGTGAVLAASGQEAGAEGLPVEPDPSRSRISFAGRDWICHPVRSAALPDGVLLAAGIPEEAPGERARLVLEQTAEALGMLFDRLPPVDERSPRRELERLLAEIVLGGGSSPVGRRRLERLAPGLDLDGELRLAVDLGGEKPDLGLGDITFSFDDRQAGLIDPGRYAGLRRDDGRLIVSAPVAGLAALPEVVPMVRRALILARRGLLRDGIVDLGQPGAGNAAQTLMGLGFTSVEAHDALASFAERLLAPLDGYDRGRGSALVETLEAYLDAGATVAGAAEKLGVHRNTLSYRIGRIEAVGGYSLSDPATRFDLQLAIAIRRALLA